MFWILNLVGWSLILILSSYTLLSTPSQTLSLPLPNTLSPSTLTFLRVVQTMQLLIIVPNMTSLMDLIFIAFHFKFTIRMIIIYLLVQVEVGENAGVGVQVDGWLFWFMVLAWAVDDVGRYVSEGYGAGTRIGGGILFNQFFVAVPFQLLTTLSYINSYIQHYYNPNPKPIPDSSTPTPSPAPSQSIWYLLRFFQLAITAFMCIKFINLWHERKRYYRRMINEKIQREMEMYRRRQPVN